MTTTIADLEGGAALCAWYGGVPSFHDARLRVLELNQGAPGRLVAHLFRITAAVDAHGFFVLDKHASVTFRVIGLAGVQLTEMREAAILSRLDVTIDEAGTTLSFESSYGAYGSITAERIAVDFVPMAPA